MSSLQHDDVFVKETLSQVINVNAGLEVISSSLIKKAIEDLDEQVILVLGVTGLGKSTLINGLTGSTLTESSRLMSCTKNITKVLSGKVTWVDTPGILDTDEPKQEFLDDLHKEMKKLKVVNKVIIMLGASRRFNESEQDSLKQYLFSIGASKGNIIYCVFSGDLGDSYDYLFSKIELMCKPIGCEFELLSYDRTEMSKLKVLTLCGKPTKPFQSTLFRELLNKENQIKMLLESKDVVQK